jgi:hypothetical protein
MAQNTITGTSGDTAVAAAADTALQASVWAYNPERGDFDDVAAVRRDRDVYELLAGGGNGFEAGDLVRVELADGELIVQERVFGQRLL